MGFIRRMLNKMVTKKDDSCLFTLVDAIQSWSDYIKGQKSIHTFWNGQNYHDFVF